jgi:hypothetical protein
MALSWRNLHRSQPNPWQDLRPVEGDGLLQSACRLVRGGVVVAGSQRVGVIRVPGPLQVGNQPGKL